MLFSENVVTLRPARGRLYISTFKGRIDFFEKRSGFWCPGTEHEPQVYEDRAILD